MKSYPRVSQISLSCTLPGVRFYISLWCSCRLTLTRRVSLVEQDLQTLTVLSGVRVAWSLVFGVVFCISLFVLFLTIVLLVLLRFRNSDYPFVSSKSSSYARGTHGKFICCSIFQDFHIRVSWMKQENMTFTLISDLPPGYVW